MSRCSCRSCHPCRFPMRPLLKVFVLFGLLVWVTGSSKAQDKVEVYGGYSYLRASVQVGQHNFVGLPPLPPVTQHGNLNGWELAGQYKFLPFLGAVVDFNGNYGGARWREHARSYVPIRPPSVIGDESFTIRSRFDRSSERIDWRITFLAHVPL